MRYDMDWKPTREDIEFTALMIGGKIQEEREHSQRYLISLVLFTPAAILLSFLIVTFALASFAKGGGHSGVSRGINIFIFMIWVIFSIFHTIAFGWITSRIVIPLAGLGLLAGIDYLIGIKFATTCCWIAYLVVMYFTLTVIGYYFPWDKPQLFQCIHDPKSAQAIAMIQMSCAVPAVMGNLYADASENKWLKKGLTPDELIASSLLLYSLITANTRLASAIDKTLGDEGGKRVTDAMFKLHLLDFKNGRISVSDSAKLLMAVPNAA